MAPSQIRLIAALSVGLGTATPATVPAQRDEDKSYGEATFGKRAWPKAAASAALLHLRNSPHEWGGGVGGFGKRFGSIFGKHVVNNSLRYAVGNLRHEQLGYDRLGEGGFKARIRHALLRTVVTKKKTTGARTVAAGNISGAFGSGFVSRLWQPARLHTWSSGVASGGWSLGVTAGSNVAREFWPEIRHPRASRQR
jgi:hypothetical protein